MEIAGGVLLVGLGFFGVCLVFFLMAALFR